MLYEVITAEIFPVEDGGLPPTGSDEHPRATPPPRRGDRRLCLRRLGGSASRDDANRFHLDRSSIGDVSEDVGVAFLESPRERLDRQHLESERVLLSPPAQVDPAEA